MGPGPKLFGPVGFGSGAGCNIFDTINCTLRILYELRNSLFFFSFRYSPSGSDSEPGLKLDLQFLHV